jgi:squalene-associated FAD-dependent desaturase
MGSEARRAVVVGGGLAGISSAIHLADAGFEVSLYERRPYLGGRVFSFTDSETGEVLDNGQHVFMKCCTEYLALLEKLGVMHKVHVQRRLDVPVLRHNRRASGRIYRVDLPPPLHLLPSLFRYRWLSPRDKQRAARVVWEMLRYPKEGRQKLDDQTFAGWLRERGQSDTSIKALWNLICLPTLNLDAERASAGMAMMVYQQGFLQARDGADIGWSKVGLSRLLDDEAVGYLHERGARVCVGTTVRKVIEREGRTTGVELGGGETVEADVVVVAVPHNRLPLVLPERVAQSDAVRAAGHLALSPIVSIHLWYDRPVTDLTFGAVLDSEVQWFFNRTAMEGKSGSGQHIALTLSGADRWVDAPKETLKEVFRSRLRQVLPGTRSARLEKFVAVREAEATFAATPGSWAKRPSAETELPGLFLAGAYTDTGWPATMEGAVRSGRRAVDLAATLVRE